MSEDLRNRIDKADSLLQHGHLPSAHFALKKVLRKEPENFAGALQKRLGHVCFDNELYAKASQLLEWARQSEIQDNLSLFQLGISHFRSGEMQNAEQCLLECAKSRPEFAGAYLQLGHIYKATGNSKAAAENYKNYAEAMRCYDEGNVIQARLKPFNTEQYRQTISDIQSVGAEETPIRGDKKPIAILVVGLPRSGTTLTEQILSSHSRVQATDELPLLEGMASRMDVDGGYIQRLSSMTDIEKKNLRQEYISGASAYFKHDSDFFIDKCPGNFLHIGLAKRIMPDTVVIDVRRDPRDVAVSEWLRHID